MELLISVAIIAVLLALLLPALVHARSAGQTAVCANNLRQLSTAWQQYLHQHDQFPRHTAQPDWRYGGVSTEPTSAFAVLDGARPINRFLAEPAANGAGGDGVSPAEVVGLFRCPGDRGVFDRAAPRHQRLSILNGKSAFEFHGTSYRANPLLLDSTLARVDSMQRPLKAAEVSAMHSRLILLGDPAWWYSSVPETHSESKLDASWHAQDRGNILALDGSVRFLTFVRDNQPYDLTPRR